MYIVSDYGKLVKYGDVLQLKKGDDIYKTIFPFKTEQLIIMGNIEITSPALRMIMYHNIDAVFLGNNGKFNGKITFQDGKSKNVFLRQKQYKLLDDADFCLKIAKSIVSSKLQNQYSFMQRIKRKRDSDPSITKNIDNMKNITDAVSESKDIEQLRGYEGLGSKYFFDVFKYAIDPEWAKFNGRNRRPPKDSVNAILSLLYTLVLFRIDAALESAGLDSYVGYFHSLDYGRKALALDLMEEYRTPIADTLTAAIFNLGVLEKEDFEETIFSKNSEEFPLEVEADGDEEKDDNKFISPEARGVLLTKDGIRKVLAQFERKLDTEAYYPLLEKNITYKDLFFEQAKHFRMVINGEESNYKPLTQR
ncbi:MAG: CRISPR-associated endonuclease Cas1 [Candidatus Acididesulfobacter diazotrophicus]|uniref:CRISPR-associated endonuclease Cas1 n=1 Tax=Candidatus Acididesulfobacter diazotrophicus TaxID=2597226 RepID=A0A519BQD5_9DELT|nr:MAG: CRISPR-associated endonuclease Cas1 [Candidatus Acididesulfobacter diazotrophicus]